jgi:hypothetical protein
MNKNELLVGFLLTLSLAFITGLLVLPLAIICAYLWALSGMPDSDKIWRRLVVPTLWALCICYHMDSWKCLFAIPISFGFLSMGYGIPATQPPDDGSWLGKFYFKLFKQNEWWANLFTRGTIYVGAICPMYILSH